MNIGASEFPDMTIRPNGMWQTGFTYLKVIGWGQMASVRAPIAPIKRQAIQHRRLRRGSLAA